MSIILHSPNFLNTISENILGYKFFFFIFFFFISFTFFLLFWEADETRRLGFGEERRGDDGFVSTLGRVETKS